MVLEALVKFYNNGISFWHLLRNDVMNFCEENAMEIRYEVGKIFDYQNFPEKN